MMHMLKEPSFKRTHIHVLNNSVRLDVRAFVDRFFFISSPAVPNSRPFVCYLFIYLFIYTMFNEGGTISYK